MNLRLDLGDMLRAHETVLAHARGVSPPFSTSFRLLSVSFLPLVRGQFRTCRDLYHAIQMHTRSCHSHTHFQLSAKWATPSLKTL